MHEFEVYVIPVYSLSQENCRPFLSKLQSGKARLRCQNQFFSVGWWVKDWKDLKEQKYEMKVLCMSEEDGSRK